MDNVLAEDEDEEDFETLIQEMKDDRTIRNQFAIIHLITKDTMERAVESRNNRAARTIEANPWVWYAFHPDSAEFRMELRRSFTKEDGRVLKALGTIVLNERRPHVGERTTGPITENEGRYITQVNKQLQAYLKERDL